MRSSEGSLGKSEDDEDSPEDTEGFYLQNVISRAQFHEAQEKDEGLHAIPVKLAAQKDIQPGSLPEAHHYEVKNYLLYRVRGDQKAGQ